MDDSDHRYKVGFQGIEGSFSHQALTEYFGEAADAVNFQSFRDVFNALGNNEIKYGILPLENSSTGGISEVYDLLGEYGFYIVGEECIKVDQNLLGIRGAEISEIEEIYSHIQGFMQSKEYFDKHPEWKLIPYHNTARSAQYISNENSKMKACVASRKAAEIYGLNILKENINDSSNNYTRFIIIGRDMELSEKCDKITIVATLPHKVGSLYRVLKHFADNDSNLLKIESRPIPGKPWEYSFYIDFQGNMLYQKTQSIFNEIKADGVNYKFLGNY
jgi:chorismate mutase / prephenate dehydratase